MITETENDMSIIFINHKKLMEMNYSKFIEAKSSLYTLREDLFRYEAKKSANNQKRKKRKFLEINTTDPEEAKEIEKVIKITKSLSDRLKSEPTLLQNCFGTDSKLDYSVQDILNDSEIFPVFFGENKTKKIIETNIKDRKYIIPPQCKFYNNDINLIKDFLPPKKQYDFIVVDPPWLNKYIKRLKSAKRELSYNMLEYDTLLNIPIETLSNQNSLVLIWCTNSPKHQRTIEEVFLTKWNLKLLSKWYWIKLNSDMDPVCNFNGPGRKQPFERLFIACHNDVNVNESKYNSLQNMHFILSVPSIVHSHKPPLFDIFESYLPENASCLELFARYLQPNFTSVGLEVLKLQDIRLYTKQ